MSVSNLLKKIPASDGTSKVLVAVSGGLDSTVLLHVLLENGWNVEVAHANFQLRGEASEGDAAFVEALCQKHKIPFHNKRFDTVSCAEKENISIQMAARDLRMEWFDELCLTHSFGQVVLGQHSNDQAETVLLHFMRGSGVKGLRGMQEYQGIYWRPLLGISKEELHQFAIENKLEWREDASNKEEKYRRNAVRLKVLPALENIQKGATENIVRSGKLLSDAEELLAWASHSLFEKCAQTTSNGIVIDMDALENCPAPKTLLFEWLREFDFSRTQIEEIWENRSGQSGATWATKSHVLTRNRRTFQVDATSEMEVDAVEIEHPSGRLSVPFRLSFKCVDADGFEAIKSNFVGQFDFDLLHFPLTLRLWKDGDKIQPFGMQGHKKVSDILIDAKVSHAQKKQVWLLESKGEAIWLIGHCIDDKYRVSPSTKRIWYCETSK